MTKKQDNWEEEFKKRFCRIDKNNKIYRLDWFLRDDITGKEMLSYIRQQKDKTRREAIREIIKLYGDYTTLETELKKLIEK